MIRTLLRRARAAVRRPRPTWRGVYGAFADVPAPPSAAFDAGDWTAASLESAQALARGEAVVNEPRPDPLAVLVAALSGSPPREVRVVDFGGSVGFGYLGLRRVLGARVPLAYHVVERGPVCSVGRDFFRADPRVVFHERLADAPARPDVTYVRTALQYAVDWRETLTTLARLEAPWLLLAQLSAGDVETYASLQTNVAGPGVPYWFLGIDEVRAVLRAEGYDPALEEPVGLPLAQGNLPAARRLGCARTLLFARRPRA